MTISPLYLDGSAGLRVRRDGPSLMVVQCARAPGRYPLQRLSRVVTDTRVEWTSEALIGCMQYGVPVFFNNAAGQTIGACYGARRREATLGNLLKLSKMQIEWNLDLQVWFDGIEQREAIACAKRLALHGIESSSVDQIYSKTVNHIYLKWKCAPSKYLAAYTTVLRPWVEQQLLDSIGGDISSIVWPAAGWHLGEKFLYLSRWHAFSLLADSRAAPVAGMSPLHWAASELHRNHPVHSKYLGRNLGQFESCLRDLVL